MGDQKAVVSIKDRAAELREYVKRWRWLDRTLVRVEAYTSLFEQYPWIGRVITLSITGMMTLYTYLAESWLPFSILVGVFTFVAIKVVPKVLRTETIPNRLSMDAHQAWSHDAAEDTIDRTAYYDLMGFTLDYLLPACDHQVELQEAIIRHVSKNEEIAALAIEGLHSSNKHDAVIFLEYYNTIVEGISSSVYTLQFSALINSIKKLEANGYRMFCLLGVELAEQNEIDPKKNEVIRPVWEKWRQSHNALIKEYDNIKSQVRFGRLFRPRKDSRWGEEIPPAGA